MREPRRGSRSSSRGHSRFSRSASFPARLTTNSEFSRLSDWSGTVAGKRRVQVVTIEGASNTSSRLAIWVLPLLEVDGSAQARACPGLRARPRPCRSAGSAPTGRPGGVSSSPEAASMASRMASASSRRSGNRASSRLSGSIVSASGRGALDCLQTAELRIRRCKGLGAPARADQLGRPGSPAARGESAASRCSPGCRMWRPGPVPK